MRGDATRLARQKFVRGLAGAIGLIAIWWVVSEMFIGGGGGRVPSPLVVGERAVDLLSSARFWDATATTFLRGAFGLLLALAGSILLAFLLVGSRIANAALEPAISLLYPVPRIALFPIAVIALGIGAVSQITLVAVECIFPLTVAIYSGLRSVDRNTVWLARNASIGMLRTAALMFRMALPAVFTGLRIAVPLMLTLTVATQMFTGSADGLGFMIVQSSARFQTANIFAIAVLIGLFGYLLDRVVVSLDRYFSRHRQAVVI